MPPPLPEPILVKRYAQSRLYDTTAAGYVTPADLRRWQADGVAFIVRDASGAAEVLLADLA